MASKQPAVPRTSKGQFVQGHSGNPTGVALDGLRVKQKIVALKENLELAIRQGPLNADRVCRVINKMIELAEKGDVKAAKLVVALAVSGAGVNNEDNSKAPAAIKIVVENATFKSAAVVGTATPSVKVTEAIDAEFTEIQNGQRTSS